MTQFARTLVQAAVAPYSKAGRFALGFAKGKLSGDPVFTDILQRGLIASGSKVVDIGCGQGLLSAWLLAAEQASQNGQWPSHWAAAPKNVSVRGIELMSADVARAKEALAAHSAQFEFVVGDMRSSDFGQAQTAVILDVLHYVSYEDQEKILVRVRNCLSPKGLLILRVGDAAGGLGFKISNWVDNVVMFVRGHRLPRLYCRSVKDWCEVLSRLGFVVEPKAMSEGTPFSNVLLLSRYEAKS
jgi:2-polyprenyl-3-methyl-5-hydroxy-6-metoxy-1,4-benzoquinol methylase